MPRQSLKVQINLQPIIDASDLKLAIQRCLVVTSTEKARFSFDLVRFKSDGRALELAASDGCRATCTKIDVELPKFEVFASIGECKALKRLCHRRGDTVAVSLGFPDRLGLTFSISTGESTTVGNDPDAPNKPFPPIDRVFEVESKGTISIADPEEFRRAVALALAAKQGGKTVPKSTPNRNMIRITCTGRKMTVLGMGNGIRAYTHLASDERATPASLMLNGAYLLDLIKFAPRAEPYELMQWGTEIKGIAFVSSGYRHYLSGMHYEKAVKE